MARERPIGAISRGDDQDDFPAIFAAEGGARVLDLTDLAREMVLSEVLGRVLAVAQVALEQM